MNYEIKMPSLGADMDQGKIVEWKIKPGDDIKKGDIIASVETTKSVMDIESFRDGKVTELVAHVGDVVPVGKVIGLLEIKDSVKESKALETVEVKENEKPIFEGINIRKAIGMAMSRSKKEIPHYYLKRRINLDALIKWLEEKNMLFPPEQRLLLPAVLAKAVVISLQKYPVFNGHYSDDKFVPFDSVNLGYAFSLKDTGVLVPAILESEKLNLHEFNLAFLDLANRTKKGGLKSRELTDGSITITNAGDLGSDEVYGVIFPPQVAIIGVGRIRKEPVIDHVNSEIIKAGFVVDVTLSADHRVTDGLLGSKLLNEIEKNLNDPSIL